MITLTILRPPSSSSSALPRPARRPLVQGKEAKKRTRLLKEDQKKKALPTPLASLEPLELYSSDIQNLEPVIDDVPTFEPAQFGADLVDDLGFNEFIVDPQDEQAMTIPDMISSPDAELIPDIDIGQDEVEKLMDLLEHNVEEPPSSVVRAINNPSRNSRSADEFDPELRYSPATEASTATIVDSDDLLRSEVDWSPIQQHCGEVSTQETWPQSTFVLSGHEAPARKPAAPENAPQKCSQGNTDELPTNYIGDDVRMRPLKTFFHVRKMLHAKSHMFRNSTAVVFELFARVVHSAREDLLRRQHFQLRDLFEDKPPYISGTLPS